MRAPLPLCWLLLAACVGTVPPDPPAGDDGGSGGPDAGGSAPAPDATAPPDAPPPAPLPAIDFDHYHTLAEIAAYLRAVAEARPGLVTFHLLGESAEDREIAYLVIDRTGDPGAPAIFLNGSTHGNEKPSTEAALAMIDHLLRNGDDPEVAAVLDAAAVFVLPLVNPDGHLYDIRGVASGWDPNRDWAHPGRPESQSFDLKETQLVKSLFDGEQFRASMSYHSGLEMIVWPWGYGYEETDDDAVFATIVGAGCDAAGYGGCMQAANHYTADGLDMDYAYWKYGTLAVTLEVSASTQPDPYYLPPLLAAAVAGTTAFMRAVVDLD